MWNLRLPDISSAFRDLKIRKVLGRYLNVLEGKSAPKFLVSKKIPADYEQSDDSVKLWLIHDRTTEQYYQLEKEVDSEKKDLDTLSSPEKSYLDLKLKLANQILQSCSFCVRNCCVNRTVGELGWCRVGRDFKVSTIFAHMGEEPELIPSGTVFTVGCNLKCLHCQNWSISQQYEAGESYTVKTLADIVRRLKSIGCRNLNMVGGEPTPYLHKWVETLNEAETSIATVWNSNSYYSEVTAKILAGVVDVYLLDFKYGNNKCAERISNAQMYWETCTRNHLCAIKYGELIIRVLLLPSHNECCTKPILEWIAKNLGTDIRLNLMEQYRPEWRAFEIPELSRHLTRREVEEAVKMARNAGLTNLTI
ncbi:MAG: radical SAM protein [Candidatus Bathyarchaeota archaeon]